MVKYIETKIVEVKINEFISLKLENNLTYLYFKESDSQTKYLLMNLSNENIKEYDDIQSIDEASDKLRNARWMLKDGINFNPVEEFWGHCNNLQLWIENDYNPLLIDNDLAITLLHHLSEAGDIVAKKVFKEEIVNRIKSRFIPVQEYLILEGFLEYFSEDELDLFENYLNFERLSPNCFLEYQKTRNFSIIKDKDNELWEKLFCSIIEEKLTFLKVFREPLILEDLIAKVLFQFNFPHFKENSNQLTGREALSNE